MPVLSEGVVLVSYARICASASLGYASEDTSVRRGARLKLLERQVYRNRAGTQVIRVALLEPREDGAVAEGWIAMTDTSFAFAYDPRTGLLGDDFITGGPEDEGIVVDEYGDAIYDGQDEPDEYLGRVSRWDRLRLLEPRPVRHPEYESIEMIKVEVIGSDDAKLVGTVGWVEVCKTSFAARLTPLPPASG